jgi:hypothetical protein
VEFGLLRPLEVIDGGRVVAIPATKQRVLPTHPPVKAR